MSRLHTDRLLTALKKSNRIGLKAEAAEILSDNENEKRALSKAAHQYDLAKDKVDSQVRDGEHQHRLGGFRNSFRPGIGDEKVIFTNYTALVYEAMLIQFLHVVADLNGNFITDKSHVGCPSKGVKSYIDQACLYSSDKQHEASFKKIIEKEGFIIKDNEIELTAKNKRYLTDLLDPAKAKEKMNTLMQLQHEFTADKLKDETPVQSLLEAENVIKSLLPVSPAKKA